MEIDTAFKPNEDSTGKAGRGCSKNCYKKRVQTILNSELTS